MQNVDVKIDFEPKDNYQKAKKDIIQALDSITKLTPDQQRKLAYELLGIEKFTIMLNLIQQINNRKF